MESREGQSGRLANLDTLRGVAIIAVIVTHTSQRFGGAFFQGPLFSAVVNLGVQLFFLVSAYTMCTMWNARRDERYRATNFYIRRLCRIAPLYWLGIVGYGLLLGWRPATDTIANALLVHSVLPSAINSVVPGGWSIGVEVAFYFVFPLLARAPAKWLLPMALLWYGTFGIAAEHWLQRLPEAFLYYSPLTQLPVFLIGMHIYHRVHSGPSVTREVAIGLAWLLMALVAKHYGWPGRPVFWVAVFILAVGLWFSARYHLGVKLLQFFGRLSYSMYLVHFAVLDLVVLMLPRTSGIGLAFALVTAGAVAVGLLSYRTGERWSQDLARQLVLLSSSRSRRTVAPATGAGYALRDSRDG